MLVEQIIFVKSAVGLEGDVASRLEPRRMDLRGREVTAVRGDELGERQSAAEWSRAWFERAFACMPFEGILGGIDVEQGRMAAVTRERKDGTEMVNMFYCRISRQDSANSLCQLIRKGEINSGETHTL